MEAVVQGYWGNGCAPSYDGMHYSGIRGKETCPLIRLSCVN